MVHKKYVKRGGKVFGPYLYENYRKNGVVKTRYLGLARKNKISVGQKKSVLLFLLLFGLVLIAGVGVFFFLRSIYSSGNDFGSVFWEAKPVNVFLTVVNDKPVFFEVPEEIYVCENKSVNFTFGVEYEDGIENVDVTISPMPFFITPLGNFSRTSANFSVNSPDLVKQYVRLRQVGDSGWALYPETLHAFDLMNSSKYALARLNITLIEVNNPPVFSLPVKTVWVVGENSFLHYNVSNELAISNEESRPDKLNFSLKFFEGESVFNISRAGVIDFNASGRMDLIGFNISRVYNLELCVNDSGIKNPHSQIDICLPEGDALPKSYCDFFSVTFTKENRKPRITNFSMAIASDSFANLSFNIAGGEELFFNISFYDPDGTVPDVYWYVDDEVVRYTKNLMSDSLDYTFGCGVSGAHFVKAVISDGLLNDSLQWNLSISGFACGGETSGGGGGGGGAMVKKPLCKEKWGCGIWGNCFNLSNSTNLNRTNGSLIGVLQGNCAMFGWQGDCGFQSRDCFDVNRCRTNATGPDKIRACKFVENPNCSDGIQNCHNESCEVLIDCGGPCTACPTCRDGIKNQNESRIDCGGACQPCAEKPLPPPIFKSVVSYLLILLLILILVFVVRQAVRYFGYKKMIKEERRKRQESSTVPLAGYAIFAFALVLILVFGFFVGFAGQEKIVVEHYSNGMLSSASVIGGLMGNLARSMMIDVVNVIVVNSDNSELRVWEDTDDSSKGSRYTFCRDIYCSLKGKPDFSFWEVYFYANYTNKSRSAINAENGNGSCFVRFNEQGFGESFAMSFNYGSLLWEYNRSFNYKGNVDFNISCVSDYGNLSVLDYVNITNTKPYILKDAGGYVSFSGNFRKSFLDCFEDTPCFYNFFSNVSEDDLNDRLIYSYLAANTSLTNFTLDSLNGILMVNVTNDRFAGENKKIELTARDSDNTMDSAILEVNIAAVNDPPFFANLSNQTFNATFLFDYFVNVSDEEWNTLFAINISFIDCFPAQWSSRFVDRNCTLFNSSDYVFDGENGTLRIRFIPQRNDVGDYIINFSVSDTSVLGNMSSSRIINFSVRLINEPPFFRYVCDNERSATEDTAVACRVNVTDLFEEGGLALSSNYSWFAFRNDSGVFNPARFRCGAFNDYNVSAVAEFVPRDAQVGNWSINVSVRDFGAPAKSNSSVFWFYVANVNDPVFISKLENFSGFSENANYTIAVNVSDDDLLISNAQKRYYNESFFLQVRTLSGEAVDWINVIPGKILGNTELFYLNFTTIAAQNPGIVGRHLLNLSVLDLGGLEDSRVFSVEIRGNSPLNCYLPGF